MTATAQAFTKEERQSYVGASEVAAIMGLSRYETPLDIFHRKMGLSPDFEDNPHIRRGNRLEHIAAEYYTEQTGHKLRRYTEALVHPEMLYFRGHVDRIVVGEKRIWEGKCPSVAAFRKMQRDGLSESYIIQAQALMGLGGYPVLTWDVFCADVWDAAVFDIEFNPAIYERIESAVRDFWQNHVIPKIPPDADGKSDIEFDRIGGQDITRREDESFTKKAAALAEASQLKSDAESLYEVAKQDVLDAVEGIPGIYEGGGLRLYYTEQPGRVTLDKKAMAADGIDLTKYEKHGKPFPSFRPYFTKGEQ